MKLQYTIRFFILFTLVLLSTVLWSQADFYLGGELSIGTMGKTGLENNLLKKKNYSPTMGGQLSASLRFFDRLGLEAGIGQHWNRTKLRDAAFEDEIDGFSLDLENTTIYWNTYAAASFFFPIRRTETYIYGKFAISNNTFKEGSITKTSSVEVSSQSIDRSLVYTANYQASNISYQPEIGIQQKFHGGNVLGLGLRYNMGQSQMMQGDYSITDNLTGDSQTDRLESVGNAFLLTLNFDFRLYHIATKEKVKKPRKGLQDIAIDVSKKKDEPKDDQPPVEINKRKLKITDKVKVHAETVTVKVWDRQTVDGDRISLNLNGEWILENYTLKKEKLEMQVKLREGVNTFVLHALNLGKIRPNTAAFTVDDGEKEHNVVLESNMKESGTLEIVYKKKKDETD